MRFAYGNITNLPDLPRRQTRADIRTIRRETGAGVIGLSEMHELEDHRDLSLALPEQYWTHRGDDDANTVSLLRSNWSVVHEERLFLHGGRLHVSPHRTARLVIVRHDPQPKLPPFGILVTQLVSGAFAKPGQLGDADGWRLGAWNAGHAVIRERLDELAREGVSVLHAGDWNRATFAPFPGSRWLYERGILKVGWRDAPGGVRFATNSKGYIPDRALHTNHPAIWVRGTLSRS